MLSKERKSFFCWQIPIKNMTLFTEVNGRGIISSTVRTFYNSTFQTLGPYRKAIKKQDHYFPNTGYWELI